MCAFIVNCMSVLQFLPHLLVIQCKYMSGVQSFLITKCNKLIGYEPADLTVHPPPRMIESGFIFFVWVSSATKNFS